MRWRGKGKGWGSTKKNGQGVAQRNILLTMANTKICRGKEDTRKMEVTSRKNRGGKTFGDLTSRFEKMSQNESIEKRITPARTENQEEGFKWGGINVKVGVSRSKRSLRIDCPTFSRLNQGGGEERRRQTKGARSRNVPREGYPKG